MTPAELLASIDKRREEIAALQELWEYLFPDFPDPGVRQYQTWLKGWGFTVTQAGMEAVVGFLNKQETMAAEPCHQAQAISASSELEPKKDYGPMNTQRLCSYITGAMRKIAAGGEQNGQPA